MLTFCCCWWIYMFMSVIFTTDCVFRKNKCIKCITYYNVWCNCYQVHVKQTHYVYTFVSSSIYICLGSSVLNLCGSFCINGMTFHDLWVDRVLVKTCSCIIGLRRATFLKTNKRYHINKFSFLLVLTDL